MEKNQLKVKDATCPAIHAALQATEKGVRFLPVPGIGSSDLVKERKDWIVQGDVVLVPAIRPDVALFHARWADDAGNVWIGRRRELATAAHASKVCLVSFEEKREGDMLEDELLAPGVVSSIYVTATAMAPRGAWPLGMPGVYGADAAHLSGYAEAARTHEGFQRYVEEHVL